jgi:peptidoglycan/xylan/chitin deacetylase (PgdA/CDA1 family)
LLARASYRASFHCFTAEKAPLTVIDRLACLTLDVEPDEREHAAIRLFDEPQRFGWFRDILRDAGAPLTAFVVMRYADRYAAALARLAAAIPVELAVHSYSHDPARTASADEVRRARDIHAALWGSGPRGYRAPYGLIDVEGIRTLISEGFQYDSSIFPTFRPDEFGYNHLRYPRTPFVFNDGIRELLEVPVAALAGCRLIYSLSFVKLFGHGVYRNLMHVFPLPDVAVIDLHPYDFYADQVAQGFRWWKRAAHLRNATNAPRLFATMIETLLEQGYRFVTVSEVANLLSSPSLMRISVSVANERPKVLSKAYRS